MTRLRVAIVGPSKKIGGMSVHVRNLAKGLRETGDEVVIIPKKEGGGAVATLGYLKSFGRDFDVVHVQGLQYFEPLVSALLAGRFRGPAPVATAHGFGGESKWWQNGAEREIMKRVVRSFGAVISISEYVTRRLQKFTGLPSDRVVTVYNGVDTRFFDPGIEGAGFKERKGITGGPVVLYVGRLAWNKGLPELVDSMREVVAAFPRAQLLLCGRGKMEGELRERVDGLGLQGNVRFEGLVPDDDLPYCYAACDALVLPSSLEPFGLVLLEAMSMRKPVVATNVGGIPEVVEDGYNGLLVSPQNSRSLAKGIIRLLSDESLQERLAKNGRATVESRFTLERMARATRDCYLGRVAAPSSRLKADVSR